MALNELRDSNFPMDRVSVIARDGDRADDIAGTEVRDRVGNKADEGATTGAVAGGALGGLTGLLIGLGTLAIPGIGPIMLAGATATAIATTVAGGAIGAAAGGLVGALIGLGIPEERARVYSDRVARGQYLVIVEGTEEEIRRAQTILSNRGIEDWDIYDISPGPGQAALGGRYRAVGVFSQLHRAEAALEELRDASFPMSQVSLVARDYNRRDWLPGLRVHNRFDNALFHLRPERHRFFTERFERGEYLVVVEGTDDEIRRAQAILNRHDIQDWDRFDLAERETLGTGIENSSDVYATPAVSQRPLARNKFAIGVFGGRGEAEHALSELRDAGFSMNQVSIIASDASQNNQLVGVPIRSRVDNYAGFGVVDERARIYHDRVSQGHYLVIVNGTDEEIRQASAILNRRGIQQFDVYDSSQIATPSATSSVTSDRDPNVIIVDHQDKIGRNF